jgi:hypothetical protein
MQEQVADALSPEKFQMVLAGLSGLAPEEVRKAKLLYLRNAASEYKALITSLEGFGKLQGCLAIIPIFWPILWAQRRMMAAQRQLANDRIDNAIEVWREDLKGERFDLGDREIVV